MSIQKQRRKRKEEEKKIRFSEFNWFNMKLLFDFVVMTKKKERKRQLNIKEPKKYNRNRTLMSCNLMISQYNILEHSITLE